MTSFMIKEHIDRKVHEEWRNDGWCTFCRVIDKELPSTVVYETDKVIAILGECQGSWELGAHVWRLTLRMDS